MRIDDLSLKKHFGIDRRVKITEEQRVQIKAAHAIGIKTAELARLYFVTPRTIEFIVFPERLAQMRQRRNEKGGWRQSYHKDKHRINTGKSRDLKRRFIASLSEKERKELEESIEKKGY